MNEMQHERRPMRQSDAFALPLDCRRRVVNGGIFVPYSRWRFMKRIDRAAARVGAAALASGRVRVLTVHSRTHSGFVNLAVVAADPQGRVAVWTRGVPARTRRNANQRAAACLPTAAVLFERRARPAGKERARRALARYIKMAALQGHLWAQVRPIAHALAWQLYTGHFRSGLRIGGLALADLLEEHDHYRAAAVRALALAGENPIPALAAYEPPLPSRSRRERERA